MEQAELPRIVTLRDGAEVVLRRLVADDREKLARAYDQLSELSRRRRFFSPPRRLSSAYLDHLLESDDDRKLAVVAVTTGVPDEGLGIARWVRDAERPDHADVAVTVTDAWQGRGLGTELLETLGAIAREHGITTFTADVLWENEVLLDALHKLGARLVPAEPGVARVEFDLPDLADEIAGPAMHELLRSSATA